jgi:hypothetical protein
VREQRLEDGAVRVTRGKAAPVQGSLSVLLRRSRRGPSTL